MQIQMVNRDEADKVFVSVQENAAEELLPDSVCEFVATTTDTSQGYLVQSVQTAVNATTGIAASVAGVVNSTITTSGTGRLQVYGPANVRASAALATGRLAVATSAGVSPTGVVTADVQTTTTTAMYAKAGLGVCLENVNATNARVMLQLM